MENFIKYINVITKEPFYDKEATLTTTILLPELDTTEGIYRSILPSYVFTGSKELRIVLAGLHSPSKVSINQKDAPIRAEMIEKTDHFVFPFVSYPLAPIIESINRVASIIGKTTPIKYSYYIDANYYLMPDTYPFANEYKTAKMIESIEQNIKAVDQVIVTNKPLKDYIADKIKEKYPTETWNTLITYQPLFILPELTKTAYVNEPEKGKIKLLIIGDDYQFTDINYIKGILKDFLVKYKNAEIHIIGWDGSRNNKNFLSDLDFHHWPKTEYYKYFELIRHIGPDCLIIPAKRDKFNATSKNFIKYLEFAYMNIPVIAPDIECYQVVIENNRNGFLAKDKDAYLFQLETMISDPEKFKGALDFAYTTASLDYNISGSENIKLLTSIYFPGYGSKKE